MPSYIMAKRPFLEIFKISGYFPDSPRVYMEGELKDMKRAVAGIQKGVWLRSGGWADYPTNRHS